MQLGERVYRRVRHNTSSYYHFQIWYWHDSTAIAALDFILSFAFMWFVVKLSTTLFLYILFHLISLWWSTRRLPPFPSNVFHLIEVTILLISPTFFHHLYSTLFSPYRDIAKQMPMEAKKFAKIDKEWAKVMSKAFDTQLVVESAANEILRAVSE